MSISKQLSGCLDFLLFFVFVFLALLRVFQRCDKSFHLIAIFRLGFSIENCANISDIFFAEKSQMVYKQDKLRCESKC